MNQGDTRAVIGTQAECRASVSGNCLQVTEGFSPCRLGECEIGDYNDAMDEARKQAKPPRRSDRPVTRVRRPT